MPSNAKAKHEVESYNRADRPPATTSSGKAGTKAHTLIALLKSKRGATIAGLMSATGWQAHSIRGFLSGALRKRYGLRALSQKADGQPRRYSIG